MFYLLISFFIGFDSPYLAFFGVQKYGYKFTYAAKQTVALTGPIFAKFTKPK
jgi:hypothetical protein